MLKTQWKYIFFQFGLIENGFLLKWKWLALLMGPQHEFGVYTTTMLNWVICLRCAYSVRPFSIIDVHNNLGVDWFCTYSILIGLSKRITFDIISLFCSLCSMAVWPAISNSCLYEHKMKYSMRFFHSYVAIVSTSHSWFEWQIYSKWISRGKYPILLFVLHFHLVCSVHHAHCARIPCSMCMCLYLWSAMHL